MALLLNDDHISVLASAEMQEQAGQVTAKAATTGPTPAGKTRNLGTRWVHFVSDMDDKKKTTTP